MSFIGYFALVIVFLLNSNKVFGELSASISTIECTTSYGNLSGVCKHISNCSSSLGLLRAGVSPDICELTKENGIVCCPTTKRISASKCEQFTSILTQPIKTKEALVYDGVAVKKGDFKSKEIICEVFIEGFISGGRKAKQREYPYQVALGYGDINNPDWRCGGTLIDNLYIISAAHCSVLNFVSGPPKIVLLGDRQLSHQKDSTRLLVKISQIYPHPEYKPPIQYFDIAVIKLDIPVNFSRSIFPACLPDPEDRLDRAMGMDASGWGQTGALEGQSDILLSATISKYDSTECSSFFQKGASNKQRLPQGIILSQFCAGDKQGIRDTCKGDSGGPVTVTTRNSSCVHYLIGVTSFGSNMCGFQQPGVYTNVLSYLDWIEDIVWNNVTAKPITNLMKSNEKVSSGSEHLILNPSVEKTTSRTTHKDSSLTETSPSSPSTSTRASTTTTTIRTTTSMPPSRFPNFMSFNLSGAISQLLSKIETGK